MNGLLDWFEERTGLRTFWSSLASERLPGGARLRYVFGSVLVFLFVLQVVLGILLASYYSSSASDAWASVAYLNDQVTAGWFLRGLHHHACSVMVVLTGLHFLQTFIAKAYRRPKELTWISGLLMMGLVLAFSITGYLLPWDQRGYWRVRAETAIMGTLPGGDRIRTILQGGAEFGNFTVTRFYAIHVFLLPIGFALLLALHGKLARKHGRTPPDLPQAELSRLSVRIFPNQLFLDVLGMAVTAAVLVFLTFHTHGSELVAPAQPTSNYVARPAFYFLPLFQLVKYFEGPLQIVATVIIPGAATTFLVLLPWIDRAGSSKLGERMPVVAGVALIMAGVVSLSAVSLAEDAKNPKYQKAVVAALHEGDRARELAKAGVLPAGGEAVFLNDPQVAARSLFKEHCETCHSIDDVGGEEAPNLTRYRSREWIAGVIRTPRDKKFFGGTKTHKEMENYPPETLSEDKLAALVEYLTSLMGDDAGPVDANLAERGKKLFADDLDCNSCHEVKPGDSGDGPNLANAGSRAWIERVVRDSSAQDLFGKSAGMPKFAKKLSQQEIRQLVNFVASQRTAKSSG